LNDSPRFRDEKIACFLAKQGHDRLVTAGLIVARIEFVRWQPGGGHGSRGIAAPSDRSQATTIGAAEFAH
jgi:hypothetical protein